MAHYSVQLSGFLPFAKNMGKSIGKNVSKSLSSKYNQKRLVHAKQSATDASRKQTASRNNSKKCRSNW